MNYGFDHHRTALEGEAHTVRRLRRRLKFGSFARIRQILNIRSNNGERVKSLLAFAVDAKSRQWPQISQSSCPTDQIQVEHARDSKPHCDAPIANAGDQEKQ
jgi:hypothetical protein